MEDETRKHLYDIQESALWIFAFVSGKSFDDLCGALLKKS